MAEPIGTPTGSVESTRPSAAKAERLKLRVAELDVLRFAAAVAVMLYHFTYQLAQPGGPQDFFPTMGRVTLHGYLGVNLFFMISGFVILWSARDRRPSEFVVSRMARLYPEYWIGVILSSIAFASLGMNITLPMVAANLTMVPGLLGQPYVDIVYWTLFVELKFYFLVWLLCLGRQMPRLEHWTYLWLGVSVYCFLFEAPAVVRSVSMYPFSPWFIAGCLFFLIRVEGPTIPRTIGVMTCLALGISAVLQRMPVFVHATDLSAATRLESSIIVVGFFALFAMISLRRRTEIPLASFVAFLGMLTYPLYLVHEIGEFLVLQPLALYDRWVALTCAIIFSIGLATLMSVLVERHWRKPFVRYITRVLVRPRVRN